MKKDSLGDRMKGYEHVAKQTLMPRTPVIIRIDGKAFHTWTKQLRGTLVQDPFSDIMNKAMSETTELLVQNIQNAVLGYTQSDEISILLNDWKTLETDQWFGNSMQKMASVSASMATAYFNSIVNKGSGIGPMFSPAMFDARVFNVPKEEVVNYFVWRQQDATRNSVQMLGRHYFSHKEMHKKNVSNIQDMLMAEHTVNWNDIDTWKKRGTCVVRGGITEMTLDLSGDTEAREFAGLAIDATVRIPHSRIEVDREIPIFTQDREYIDKLLKAVTT